ncbi:MAG TPA: hypothetical protein VH134_11245 [Candidatus Dormibacteraeota bacterium]|jgi:hypothetical protein|nr:hypothetical protein [Candidatus Dormibacteraeota bacterium]
MTWVALYLVVAVLVLGFGALTWKLGRERYRPSGGGPAVPTDEVLVDPETGRRQRVHMNPATGARTYVDEPGPDRGS